MPFVGTLGSKFTKSSSPGFPRSIRSTSFSAKLAWVQRCPGCRSGPPVFLENFPKWRHRAHLWSSPTRGVRGKMPPPPGNIRPSQVTIKGQWWASKRWLFLEGHGRHGNFHGWPVTLKKPWFKTAQQKSQPNKKSTKFCESSGRCQLVCKGNFKKRVRRLAAEGLRHQKRDQHISHTSWAPTSYKWSYNPYKWPYNWVTGVITPISGLITILITGRGPTLYVHTNTWGRFELYILQNGIV